MKYLFFAILLFSACTDQDLLDADTKSSQEVSSSSEDASSSSVLSEFEDFQPVLWERWTSQPHFIHGVLELPRRLSSDLERLSFSTASGAITPTKHLLEIEALAPSKIEFLSNFVIHNPLFIEDEHLQKIQSALLSYVEQMPPEQKVSIYTYSDAIYTNIYASNNKTYLKEVINNLKAHAPASQHNKALSHVIAQIKSNNEPEIIEINHIILLAQDTIEIPSTTNSKNPSSIVHIQDLDPKTALLSHLKNQDKRAANFYHYKALAVDQKSENITLSISFDETDYKLLQGAYTLYDLNSVTKDFSVTHPNNWGDLSEIKLNLNTGEKEFSLQPHLYYSSKTPDFKIEYPKDKLELLNSEDDVFAFRVLSWQADTLEITVSDSNNQISRTLPIKITYTERCLEETKEGEFCDRRDGKVYTSKTYGQARWMTQNLNLETTGSRCYQDNPYFCDDLKKGRLYLGSDLYTPSLAGGTAALPKNLCPEGWQVPTHSDIDYLFQQIAKEQNIELKSLNDTLQVQKHLLKPGYWNKSEGLTNQSEFSLLGSGVLFDGEFWGSGDDEYLAVAFEGYRRVLQFNSVQTKPWYLTNYSLSGYFISVRCLQMVD